MKALSAGAAILLLNLTFALPPALAVTDAPCRRVEMFSRPGCPHCESARAFLEELQHESPSLDIEIRDVGGDPAALRELETLARHHAVTPVGVPAFRICGAFLVGFRDSETSGRAIRSALSGTDPARAPPSWVALPWWGRLQSEDVGLVGFTLMLGLLDGFNPCAMWVLLILLSVLVGIRDRRKLVLVAGTFVAVSGMAYFVFMATWLNALLWIGWSRPLQVVLGAFAVAVGALHAKDVVAPQRGPSLSIPEAAKPGLYRRLRAVRGARSLVPALAGAAALAVTANAVELLCTAGLPALYTQVLTLRELSSWEYYGYLALYNLAYLTDDLLIVGAAVATLHRFKLQERHGRWLKAVSAALMLGLGFVLWLRPSWLTV